MSLLVLFSAPEKRTDWGLGVNPQQGKTLQKKNSEECSLFQKTRLFCKSLTCFTLGRAQASLALLSLLQQVHHTDEQGDDSRHGSADGTDIGDGLLGGGGLRGNDDLTAGLYLGATLGLGDRTILRDFLARLP